ncbi:hypothetical protein PV326_012031 [Microctonus aethiopoides]|nr:hypothetical protein PV326_012031 [Microctonus aethiopoides]
MPVSVSTNQFIFSHCHQILRQFNKVFGVAHTTRDRAAELQAEVRSAIRVLNGWCPRGSQQPAGGHTRGDTVLMAPQTQMRGGGSHSGAAGGGGGGGGGGVQRTGPNNPSTSVVVSSTSSMRPPPPPPPPRARPSAEGKGHHEEPTSSIPDLVNNLFELNKMYFE